MEISMYTPAAWTHSLIQKFSAKKEKVYGNFHVTLWTKAAVNLDHQVSIEISM